MVFICILMDGAVYDKLQLYDHGKEGLRMKKKTIALLLTVCLLLGLAGVSAAADDKLAFVSVNDTLPPELINCAAAYGGMTYVPYYVFTNYGFGIGYTYLAGESTACLYSGDRQLYFDMENGDTYDGDNYQYSVPAIMRSGTVYVPLSFTARFFGGISYSSIAGNEYGSILRITDGTEVLTDAEFLRAAKMVMQNYFNRYQGSGGAGAVSPDGEDGGEEHVGERVTLSFIGIPADEILDRLAQDGTGVCCFLTAEQIRSDPDTVRRLVCQGHSVGAYCTADLAAEYGEISALLFETAQTRTELVTAAADYAEACREQADMGGLVYCDFLLNAVGSSNAFAVTSFLESGSGGASLCLDGGADYFQTFSVVLNYLRNGKFAVGAPRETD